MERIELLKSLVRKNGELPIPNDVPSGIKKAGETEALTNVIPISSAKESSTIKKSMEKPGKQPCSSESFIKGSSITMIFAKEIQTSIDSENGATAATGENNMKDENKADRYPDTMPVKKQEPVVYNPTPSVQEMKNEIWKTLMDMKSGKIDIQKAREFSVGCNTIAKFIRLEIDFRNSK